MFRLTPLPLYNDAETPPPNDSSSMGTTTVTTADIISSESIPILYLMRLHLESNSSSTTIMKSLMNPKNLSKHPFTTFLMLEYGCIASEFILKMVFLVLSLSLLSVLSLSPHLKPPNRH